jgi:hypothetical protein
MSHELRGEIWEIQGILYAIFGTQIHHWARYIIYGWALSCIIFGMRAQWIGRKDDYGNSDN